MQQMDVRLRTDGLRKSLGKEVTLLGEVKEASLKKGGSYLVLIETSEQWSKDKKTPQSERIIAFLPATNRVIRPGDQYVLRGTLHPIININNPGGFNAEYYYASRRITGSLEVKNGSFHFIRHSRNIHSQLMEWRDFLAQTMNKYLTGVSLGVAQALILADKTNLDQEVTSTFSSTGAMHVLAVSGLHIGLLLVMFNYGISLFGTRVSTKQRIIFTFVIIWIYGGITGGSAAVLRAVFMFSFTAIGQLFHRKATTMNGLAISAIILLIMDPWTIFDLGFQLSYAAMLGILLIYQPIASVYTFSHKWLQLTWEGTAVGIAATCFTFPITTYWFYQFPNYFALANLGVMVLGFLVLLLGLIFLLSTWIPYVIIVVAWVFTLTIVSLVTWIAWIDKLPGAVSGGFHLPIWMVIALFICLGIWVYHLNYNRFNRWVVASFTLLFFVCMSYQRITYFKQNELIIFASNQLIVAIREGKKTHAFYTKKYKGIWEIPKELKSFESYSGTELIVHQIEQNTMIFNNQHWKLNIYQKGPQLDIIINNKKHTYWLYGQPPNSVISNDKRAWMSLRLQQRNFPNENPKCIHFHPT